MYVPKCKSYFSGMGLMDVGLLQAGVDIIQSLDLDKDAVACMRENKHFFNHHILHADIKDICVLGQPKSDMIVGTYPCTRYSTIADIHGVRTGDDLFLHFFRHIAIEQPEMYIVENVPGMKKFKVVMEAMTQLPDYYVKVFCPVETENWLPQRRRRLILIGTRKPFFIGEPGQCRNRVKLKDIIESNPDVPMPDYVLSRMKGQYRDKPIIVDPSDPGAVAPTCVAHYSKDLGTRMVKDPKSRYGVRPFSIREYARLQGVPDDMKLPDRMSTYRLIGNGVPVHMGRWCGFIAMNYFNQNKAA